MSLEAFTEAEIPNLPADYIVFRGHLTPDPPIDDPAHAIMAKGQELPDDLAGRITEYRERVAELTGADSDPDIASGEAEPYRRLERLTVLDDEGTENESTSGAIRVTAGHSAAGEQVGYVPRSTVHAWLGAASLGPSIEGDKPAGAPLGPDFVAVFDQAQELRAVAVHQHVGETDPTDDFVGSVVTVYRAAESNGEQGIPGHVAEYALTLHSLYKWVSVGPERVEDVVPDDTVDRSALDGVEVVPPKPYHEHE